jgi:ribosomal protein L29
MKVLKWLFALMAAALIAGCGGGVDETKSVEQVKIEASEMSQAKLRKTVAEYETVIAEKASELDALNAQLKELSISELMGEKAKTLKTELGDLSTSLSTLKDHLGVYAKQLEASEE